MIQFKNINFFAGGLFGATAIALNAYAAHILSNTLSPHDFEGLLNAIRYQQIHALLLIVLGWQGGATRLLNIATIFVVLGVFLFSGSIYASLFVHLHAPFPLAPVGGVCFMLAWLTIALAGLGKKSC